MSAPVWATDLLHQAWTAYAPTTPPPSLRWTHRRGMGSSGRAWPSLMRIHVTAGTDREDNRIVLLHEIAHCLRGLADPNAHHDTGFWILAWLLFRRYHGSVSMVRIVNREDGYRVESTHVAAWLGVSEARERLEHRAAVVRAKVAFLKAMRLARAARAAELAAAHAGVTPPPPWQAGIHANPRVALQWQVRKGTGVVHLAAMESVGFWTRCGKVLPYREVVARARTHDDHGVNYCRRCVA